MRAFNGIIQNIDTLSNKIGDRHRPVSKPKRHHAKLVVDSAKTISDFLFSTMEYQAGRSTAFLKELLSLLDGEKRLLEKEQLSADRDIEELVKGTDKFQ